MQQAAYRKSPPAVPSASAFAAGLLRAPATALATLAAWQRRAEERAQLAQLTDLQLHDLGLSRAAVEDMARKPFWIR